jgi:site-specific recombinase XerD
MAKDIKLLIREDSVTKSGKARIEFLLYFEKKQYRISSGKSIEPKYWIQRSELVDKKSEDASQINSYLSERILYYNKYKQRKEILGEKLLLDEIKRVLKGEPIEEVQFSKGMSSYPTISEVFDEYVNVTNMRSGSKKNHKITRNVVVEFCKVKYHKELTIDKVDYNFLVRFAKYLREERSIPNQQNTIAKRLKLLKTILRYTIRTGKKIEDPFINFTIENGEHKKVALTDNEYKTLQKVQLPPSACKSLKLTKHIFIFCCETGLRFSDAMDLSWKHVDEKVTSFEKLQVKTDKPVFVPISNQAKAIMIVYKNQYKDSQNHVFPRIDIQLMNRELKKLAKIAGIAKNLTSHVARHTFGTRLGASGKVSAFQICDLMGHKDVSMSQRYINLSKDDLRKTMARVWEKN